jgi:ribosomal protein S27AE
MARDIEITLAEKKEKEEKLKGNNNNNNNNNNNKNNNNNNKNTTNVKHKFCANCGAATILNRILCSSCFKNKNNNNNNNNINNINNNNINNSHLRNDHNNNIVNNVKINNNINNSKNKNNSSSSPDSSSSLNNNITPPDFTKNRVKYLKKDDDNINPLFWSQEKLEREKRCGFCAQPVHSPGNECKYPKYSFAEVRSLKYHNINPPFRKDRPSGDPVSP